MRPSTYPATAAKLTFPRSINDMEYPRAVAPTRRISARRKIVRCSEGENSSSSTFSTRVSPSMTFSLSELMLGRRGRDGWQTKALWRVKVKRRSQEENAWKTMSRAIDIVWNRANICMQLRQRHSSSCRHADCGQSGLVHGREDFSQGSRTPWRWTLIYNYRFRRCLLGTDDYSWRQTRMGKA
jgi:hypothetical protein